MPINFGNDGEGVIDKDKISYETVNGCDIPRSYEFERDLEPENNGNSRLSGFSINFSEEANDEYLVVSEEDLKDNDLMLDIIKHFYRHQYPRFKTLKDYSEGNNTAIRYAKRRTSNDKADYRIRHNIGGFITNFTTSYIVGEPVTIEHKEASSNEAKSQIEEIESINDVNDSYQANYNLAFDSGRYGRGYEVHFRDNDNLDRFVIVSPLEMFSVKLANVDKPLIGAFYLPVFNGKMYPTLYTRNSIVKYKEIEFKGVNNVKKLEEVESKKHYYNDVPIVEWENNRFKQGDFENQLELINAYDSVQSDTANYMTDLVDAILFFTGDFDLSNFSKKDIAQMRDSNIFIAPTGTTLSGTQTNAKAEYLYKQYDVTGSEAYKDRLTADITTLAGVPDLSDEKFGNQSGVAMAYKLLRLKQLKSEKESHFNTALTRRYRLIDNIHKELNTQRIEPEKLTFRFHENLPEDVWTEVDKFTQAGGELSQQTLCEIASFTDYEKERKRIFEEETAYMTDEEKAFAYNLRDKLETQTEMNE